MDDKLLFKLENKLFSTHKGFVGVDEEGREVLKVQQKFAREFARFFCSSSFSLLNGWTLEELVYMQSARLASSRRSRTGRMRRTSSWS